mgnify:CR=1 FL=1
MPASGGRRRRATKRKNVKRASGVSYKKHTKKVKKCAKCKKTRKSRYLKKKGGGCMCGSPGCGSCVGVPDS